jgi:hypothetical protein
MVVTTSRIRWVDNVTVWLVVLEEHGHEFATILFHVSTEIAVYCRSLDFTVPELTCRIRNFDSRNVLYVFYDDDFCPCAGTLSIRPRYCACVLSVLQKPVSNTRNASKFFDKNCELFYDKSYKLE